MSGGFRLRALAAPAVLAALLAGSVRAGAAGPAEPAGTIAAKPSCDLLVVAGSVLTMDDADRALGRTGICVSGGAIAALGDPDELARTHAVGERIDRPDAVVLPGFVNTHTHAAMSLLRGVANDQPLMQWLQKSIFPAEAKNVSPDFVRAGTRLTCLEMVEGGTTTFADMYYFESDVADVVDAAGLRGVLGETWLDFPVPDHKDLAEEKAVTEAFLLKWKGHPRITAAVAPHAPYTCGKETLQAARALADRYGAPLLIHVSETRDEQRQIREKYGTTPTRWLDSIGFLGPRVLFAHGVWLDADDLALMARRGVALSHNPESNMMLASGVAPVVAARKAGVVVALGTDGVAGSNNDVDMIEAADIAGKLAKVSTFDPTALTARELLRMATRDGARALGLADRVGSLEVGKRADLIAVELDRPWMQPVYDLAAAVVYSADRSDVSLTVVDGKVLWDGTNARTLDRAAILAEAARWRERVRASLATGEGGGKK